MNPQNAVKGDLRSKFGNPTPLALLGFLLSLSPLSCEMMGWKASGGGNDAGIAGVGSYYFIVCLLDCLWEEKRKKTNLYVKGGLLMTLGGILEFFLGNTFSFVVFCSFGMFGLYADVRVTRTDMYTRWFLVYAGKHSDTKFQCIQHLPWRRVTSPGVPSGFRFVSDP